MSRIFENVPKRVSGRIKQVEISLIYNRKYFTLSSDNFTAETSTRESFLILTLIGIVCPGTYPLTGKEKLADRGDEG